MGLPVGPIPAATHGRSRCPLSRHAAPPPKTAVAVRRRAGCQPPTTEPKGQLTTLAAGMVAHVGPAAGASPFKLHTQAPPPPPPQSHRQKLAVMACLKVLQREGSAPV